MATWAKEGAWDPKVPGSNPGTAEAANLYKNATGQPRSEGIRAGVIHDPCLLAHAHNDDYEERMCHYVATVRIKVQWESP